MKLKELKPTLYENYSDREIGLFGSFSQGNYTDDSDIDILVELESRDIRSLSLKEIINITLGYNIKTKKVNKQLL